MNNRRMRSIKIGAHRINPEVIKQVMCTANNIDKSTFEEDSRRSEIVLIRHTYIYLCRKYSGLGVVPLGKLVRKDHTTISYILDKIDFLNGKDDYITELITNFEKTMFHNETFNERPRKNQEA